MKKNILALTIGSISFCAMAASPLVVELPNGAIGNPISATKAYAVADIGGEDLYHTTFGKDNNMHALGRDIYAPAVIETPEGLIVIGTGDNNQEGAEYRDYIRDNISTAPIIAVIYDHNHYVKGTKAMLRDDPDAIRIAHPDMHEIVTARTGDSQSNTEIPEMAPHLLARANIHYGVLAAKTGQDAPLIPMSVVFGGENGYLQATRTVADGEKMTIGGTEVQFFHHETDTKDTITTYFPEYDLVVSNVVWPTANMYTLRGDAYRAPATWLGALKEIRDLNPQYVLDIGSGAKLMDDKDYIRDNINATLDAQNYAYDQAIRLTNLGVSPDQIKHHVPMPTDFIDSNYVNNGYGQYDTFMESFAVRNHGQFSGNPEDLHNLSKLEAAEKLIALAGGVENVYIAWSAAIKNGDSIWAKELSQALYYNAPNNDVARQAHADSLRKLGQESEGLIARNFYMAGAHSLENDDTKYTLMATPDDAWVATNVKAVDYLRTRINPAKAGDISGKIIFNIDGMKSQLEIRNRTAEFSTTIDADAQLITVSGKDFARYYKGELKASDIASGEALQLLSVFDEYQPVTMFPRNFDHLK